MTMLDGERFAVLALLFVATPVATQLFVPELILDPSAILERVAGAVVGESVMLGVDTRGVESPAARTEDVETEGTRIGMPVPD